MTAMIAAVICMHMSGFISGYCSATSRLNIAWLVATIVLSGLAGYMMSAGLVIR